MSKINIGIEIDLDKLISSRLLIQASSGGGKSYAIRKLAEACMGQVQVIIIDIEGEFVTLREKFPFALVSKEGEIPLNIKYAETLAHKLLETNLSAIIDLSEMEVYQRRIFVKRFAHALIESPKHLWHPCVVIIDEADFYAPQGKDSESTNAVINLSSRGRKRGICPVYATQRIAKLHKDVTADVLNKIIGLTGQDIDQQRAGSELGFTNKQDVIGLRKLLPGEFYGYGPAISNEVIKFKVSKTITSHMEAGKYKQVAPPTPVAIKKILSKLESIPDEAEKELNTKQQLQDEIKRLKGELRNNKVTVSADNPKVWDEKLKQEVVSLKSQLTAEKTFSSSLVKVVQNSNAQISKVMTILSGVSGVDIPEKPVLKIPVHPVSSPVAAQLRQFVYPPINDKPKPISGGEPDKELSKSGKAFLQVMCMYYPEFISRSRISLISGYTATSSNFGNTLTELRVKGYLKDGVDKTVAATEEGFNNVGHFEPLPKDPESLKSYWSRKLSKSGTAFFLSLFDQYPNYTSREDVATDTGYNITSSNFGNTLTELRTLGLLQDGPDKTIRVHEDLFNN